MERRKGFIGVFLIIIMVLPMIVNTMIIQAASATVSFSTESSIVSKGNSLTISLMIDADETIGGFEGFVSYDSDILEFEKAGNSITGGEGILRISDTEISDGDEKRKYAMKFKALKVGTCEFSMSDTPMVYSYDTGEDMSVSSNGISVKVMTAERASKDASLADIRISPGTFSPAFSPDTFSYHTDIDSNVNEIIVSAKTNHEKASVQVRGNTTLTEGENKIILTVRAESGDTKEYIINVNKEETTKTADGKDNTEGENIENSPYIEGTYRYEQAIPESDIIPDGYVKTEITMDSNLVTAYAPKDTIENEFLLIYATNDKGEKNFYQYDRIEKTMQRYIENTENKSKDVEHKTSQASDAKEYNAKLNQLSLIIAVLSAFCALMLIVVIRQFLKYKGYKDELE